MPRKTLPFTKEIRARWRKVQKAILNEPKAYRQHTFGEEDGHRPTCNTPACLAGWYAFYSPRDKFGYTQDAVDLINRDTGLGWDIATATGAAWPEPFATQFLNAKTAKAEAKVAAARIDHMLKTGE